MSQAERPLAGAVLHVVIAARQVLAAVHGRGGWQVLCGLEIAPGQEDEQPLDPVIAALSQVHQAVHQALHQAAPAGLQEVRVVVADSWLATTTLPWSSDLHSPATAAAHARAALAAAGCEIDPRDTIRIDDAPYGVLRLAVAYPHALLAALQVLAQAGNVPLRSVRPLSTCAWASRLRGSVGALGLCDDGMAMVMVGGRRITEAHSRCTTSMGADPLQDLQRLWQRLRLREPALAAIERLPVFMLCAEASDASAAPELALLPRPSPPADGTLPPVVHLLQAKVAAADALDAMAGAQRPLARHWLPAAVAGLAACAMSLLAWQSMAEVKAVHGELAAAQRAARPPAVPSAAWTREELARVRAVNQAVRELNLPIGALLAALQPPRDVQVSVLGVEVGAAAADGASTLRIAAEAQGAIDMTRYVAYVAARRPLQSAYLLRHEVADKTPQERRYRFTVEATWTD